MRVITKAYGDRPLDREAVEMTGRVAYVVARDEVGQLPRDELSGVGFPLDCVFEFDSERFGRLNEAWNSGDDRALQREWAECTPITVPA